VPAEHSAVGEDHLHSAVGDAHLRTARREARHEAAPFALAILLANLVLALGSRWAGWELFGSPDWWLWLLLAGPSALLFVTLVLGPGRVGFERLQREAVIGLLLRPHHHEPALAVVQPGAVPGTRERPEGGGRWLDREDRT